MLETTLLEDKTSQYCDDICKGLAEHFMCRNMECLFVTNSAQWVRRTTKEKFRCPKCLQEYKPWVASNTRINCQKLMVLSKSGGKTKMYPVQWSDTTQQLLKNRLKEIFMDLKTELRGVNGHEAIREFWEEKARNCARPYFDDHTFSGQAEIDWINSQGAENQKDPWTYKHIEGENKLKGFFYKHDPDQPILDYVETARIYGMFLVSVELGKKIAEQ